MQSHPLYHCISCDPCDEQTEAQGEEEAPHWAPTEATTQLEFKISAFSKKKKNCMQTILLNSLLNVLQYCFGFMFWCFGNEACGI